MTSASRIGATSVAVDGVTLEVERGATVGLAGESGCGKSTLAMSVLRLLPRTARIEGSVTLGGEDVTAMSWGRLRAVRWTGASIVFQGAMHSLNPVHQVRRQIAEALELHRSDDLPDARRAVDARRRAADARSTCHRARVVPTRTSCPAGRSSG